MPGWDQKAISWLTAAMSLTFIILGVGVISGWLFANSTMSKNARLIFGGFILIYGIVRLTTIYLKSRKKRLNHNEQIDDEAKL